MSHLLSSTFAFLLQENFSQFIPQLSGETHQNYNKDKVLVGNVGKSALADPNS